MISTLLFIILVSLIYLILNPIKKKQKIETFTDSENNKINLIIQLNNNNVTFYCDTNDTDFEYFLLYIIPNNKDILKLSEQDKYIPSKKFVKVINSKNGNNFFSKTILNVIKSIDNKYQVVGYKHNESDGSFSTFPSNIVEIKNIPKVSKEVHFESITKCEVDGSYHITYGDPTDKTQDIGPNLDSPEYLNPLISSLNIQKNNYDVEIEVE
tara:strand:+ start:104 stop:736 length:633 start_codon:yes stop_codon:yes gene_type:complete